MPRSTPFDQTRTDLRAVSDDMSDEAMMAAVAAGDQRAFRLLVDRHALRARSTALRYVRDISLAEDVVQDIFTQLWQKPQLFDARRGALNSWLARLVVNRAIDVMRRRREVRLPEGHDRRDPAPIADHQLQQAQEDRHIMDTIRRLPGRQKTAIILTYFDERSNRESAAIMKMDLKAFESLLYRARAALKAKLPLKLRTKA